MKSLILQVALKILFPVLLIVSVLILFRGHNEPGGGFIGGLLAASAFILKTFVFGAKETERDMILKPMIIIFSGLFIAFFSAILPLFTGAGFFEGLWTDFYLPVIGRPGTPLLFDTGIFLLVIGVVCKIIFSISE